jgi:DnaK suppressor protein
MKEDLKSTFKERFMDMAVVNHFKKIFLEILSDQEDIEAHFLPSNREGDEVDLVAVEKENQMDLRLRARNAVYLKKVRKSLQKIEDGSFGECENCGIEISFNRLNARPTADLCIQCKEAKDLTPFNFYVDRLKGKDGFRAACKMCESKKKGIKQINPDRSEEKIERTRIATLEKLKQYCNKTNTKYIYIMFVFFQHVHFTFILFFFFFAIFHKKLSSKFFDLDIKHSE